MKVKIGPHPNWWGPYQIADALCWWVPEVADEYGLSTKPDWVHAFGTWLAENKSGGDSWLARVCQWIHDALTLSLLLVFDVVMFFWH